MKQKLTRVEEEIMQLVWSLGPTTVSHLISHIKGKKPPHSTIFSVMRILEEKGFLMHKTYGKTFEYYPIIAKADYSKFSLENILQKYFNGNPKSLISSLVEDEKLGLKELEELLKIIKDKNNDC